MADSLSFKSGITLPSTFSPTTPASLRAYVAACLDFLTSPLVSSLLECHPNDIAVDGPRPEWLVWWQWAANGRARWKSLVPGWSNDKEGASNTPLDLRTMLETIDVLTLSRTPDSGLDPSSPDGMLPMRGMSPKKSHEVSQMSAFIGSLTSQTGSEIRHIVDVGAGQGYLSRALSEPPLSMNVLALDFSEVQTKGAERRKNNIEKKKAKENVKRVANDGITESHTSREPDLSGHDSDTFVSPKVEGTVTHEMIHIDPQTLNSSVTRWISAQSSSSPLSSSPAPVVLVALHACGTLTPDVLRCFLACRYYSAIPHSRNQESWYPAGLVVVGCCYNLMSPNSDFPLSKVVSDENEKEARSLLLSYNHRSLAAQSPLQWSINDTTKASAELALRKVVYRALFAHLAALSSQTMVAGVNPGDGKERHGKIGRLRDSAYTSLEVFITQANKKVVTEVPSPANQGSELQNLNSSLQVLHVLRSRLGPVVESLILVDRWLYLVENMPDMAVRAINLFDQERGSGRNVALVVSPCTVPV